jgi:hypothetical protein
MRPGSNRKPRDTLPFRAGQGLRPSSWPRGSGTELPIPRPSSRPQVPSPRPRHPEPSNIGPQSLRLAIPILRTAPSQASGPRVRPFEPQAPTRRSPPHRTTDLDIPSLTVAPASLPIPTSQAWGVSSLATEHDLLSAEPRSPSRRPRHPKLGSSPPSRRDSPPSPRNTTSRAQDRDPAPSDLTSEAPGPPPEPSEPAR